MKKINLKQIKNVFKKIKPVEFCTSIIVVALSCVIIVPSVVQCVMNRNKAKCSSHISAMINILSDELEKEMDNGGGTMHELIENGNYQKLIATLNDKTELSDKFPSLNYYVRTGDEKLTIMCKKHKSIVNKTIKFSLMKNVSVKIAEKPQISEQILYLRVSGPDTYFQGDILDTANPKKTVFKGREVDKVFNSLNVTAVYLGGAEEVLPRSKYTVITKKLNMNKSGQTELTVKFNSRSLWDNSAYGKFTIDVVGDNDITPLIIDGDAKGRFELASWEWNDFVTEASLEDGGKIFGASIIRYNGNYYYYPDGLRIENDNSNNDMFKFALDTDSDNPAYFIEFDLSSVVLNENDKKIHNGSIKIENDFVYIWQEQDSKELKKGWIRVYCDLTKY